MSSSARQQVSKKRKLSSDTSTSDVSHSQSHDAANVKHQRNDHQQLTKSSAAVSATAITQSSYARSSTSASVVSPSFSLSSSSSTSTSTGPYVQFEGSRIFRQRVLCSILSGRPIRICNIRTDIGTVHDGVSVDGIADFEASFLRIIEKITNGTVIQINHTGDELRFRPGLIVGGGLAIERHNCALSRGIGYYLECLIPLAIFGKSPLSIILSGITNNDLDCSVDIHRTVTVNTIKPFGIDGLEVKILKRGALPLGGGEVLVRLPVVKNLKAIRLLDEGKVKRVRGLAYTTRCSPGFASRLVDGARSVLNSLLPDVYIYTEHFKGKESGLSPGYGLGMVAETTTQCAYTAEVVGKAENQQPQALSDTSTSSSVSTTDSDLSPVLPEDLGRQCARHLLEDIANGGVVCSSSQSLMLLLMILCPEDVSKIRLGKLTSHTIECLRLYRTMFGVQFKMVPDEQTGTILLSCKGIGYKNLNRKIS